MRTLPHRPAVCGGVSRCRWSAGDRLHGAIGLASNPERRRSQSHARRVDQRRAHQPRRPSTPSAAAASAASIARARPLVAPACSSAVVNAPNRHAVESFVRGPFRGRLDGAAGRRERLLTSLCAVRALCDIAVRARTSRPACRTSLAARAYRFERAARLSETSNHHGLDWGIMVTRIQSPAWVLAAADGFSTVLA
jgi:hypothetical protein